MFMLRHRFSNEQWGGGGGGGLNHLPLLFSYYQVCIIISLRLNNCLNVDRSRSERLLRNCKGFKVKMSRLMALISVRFGCPVSKSYVCGI